MSSSHLHTELMGVQQREIAAAATRAQHLHALRVAGQRPRRGATSGRRYAAAVMLAVGVASGSAAIVAVSGNTPEATARGFSTETSARVFRVDQRFSSLERRIRHQEARGFVAIACALDGELMFNPLTHRYETVRA